MIKATDNRIFLYIFQVLSYYNQNITAKSFVFNILTCRWRQQQTHCLRSSWLHVNEDILNTSMRPNLVHDQVQQLDRSVKVMVEQEPSSSRTPVDSFLVDDTRPRQHFLLRQLLMAGYCLRRLGKTKEQTSQDVQIPFFFICNINQHAFWI